VDANSKRQTILVVYPDPGIREFVRAILQHYGYNVVQEPDAAAALALLQDNDQIDLLLIGLLMPGIDAIELANRARRQNAHLKVLFASGGFGEDRLEPTDRFLRMPFTTHRGNR
jgi:CheY-like chemotaxis protein